MFFFGRLSDHIGRRPVVMASLAIAAVSAVIFLLAGSFALAGGVRLSGGTAWLFPARILSGLAIALAASASTAWILELKPRGDRLRATRVAICANLLGLGAGALLAGALGQFAPLPLQLPYVAFLVLLMPIAWPIHHLTETVKWTRPLAQASMQPRLGMPRAVRTPFLGAATAALTVFSLMGHRRALGPGGLAAGG
jgi:MFS family permease